jgi:hypothetical protein
LAPEISIPDKTIPGGVVRAIVKKQYRPDLFPLMITKQL